MVAERTGEQAAASTRQANAAAGLPALREAEARAAAALQRLVIARETLDREEARARDRMAELDLRLTQLNERLGQFMGAFEHDRLDEPEARVAHTIADMLHPQLYPNREGRIEISNEELGHLVGASRQRVNQALHALEKSGLIKVAYRVITVLDIEGLRTFGV